MSDWVMLKICYSYTVGNTFTSLIMSYFVGCCAELCGLQSSNLTTTKKCRRATIFQIFIWESRYFIGYTVRKIQLSPKCFVSSNLYSNSYFYTFINMPYNLTPKQVCYPYKMVYFICNKGVGTASQQNSKYTDVYHSNN